MTVPNPNDEWKCPTCGHCCPGDDVTLYGYPISEMIRRGWLGDGRLDARDTPAVNAALAKFFDVATIEDVLALRGRGFPHLACLLTTEED